MAQANSADNMTDRMAALATLNQHEGAARDAAMADFYKRYQGDPLIVDKWFNLQASTRDPSTLDRVRALTGHPAFSLGNPNRVRALIGMFAQGNPTQFNRADGAAVLALAGKLAANQKVVREGWNGFNILHTEAALVGALDVGQAVGRRSGPERRPHAGGRRRVAHPRAAVHVVGAETGAEPLLEEVVLLVGALGRRETAHAVGAVLVGRFPELAGRQIDGLLPGDLLEPTRDTTQRSGHPIRILVQSLERRALASIGNHPLPDGGRPDAHPVPI